MRKKTKELGSSKKLRAKKGVAMVAVVALMVFFGVFGAVATSMVGSNVGASQAQNYSTEALALAKAGVEYYFEFLQNEPDWQTVSGTGDIFIDSPSDTKGFKIEISSQSADNVTFKSTGFVSNSFGNGQIKRWIQTTAEKTGEGEGGPVQTTYHDAFNYALFMGSAYGTPPLALTFGKELAMGNKDPAPVVINGETYLYGNLTARSSSSVSAGDTINHADTASITCEAGATCGTKVSFSPPDTMVEFPPSGSCEDETCFNNTYYMSRINAWDAALDNNTSSPVPGGAKAVGDGETFDLGLATECTAACPSYVSGRCCYFASFTTSGNATITGEGGIFTVGGDIDLHYTNGTSSNGVTVTPSGSGIAFVSADSVRIGSDNDPNVQINANLNDVAIYARDDLNAPNGRVELRGGSTDVYKGLIMSRRFVSFREASSAHNDTVVYTPDNDASGMASGINFRIDRSGETGSFQGTLISEADDNVVYGLGIDGYSSGSNIVIEGAIYAKECHFVQMTFSGSIVCEDTNLFLGEPWHNSTITYNASLLPDPPAEGMPVTTGSSGGSGVGSKSGSSSSV